MAALPYIQVYIADYLADTAHLTTLQHGAYLLLIFNYWQRGKPLSNSNERLASVARMSNEDWKTVQPILAEFFTVTDSEWIHHRIEGDLLDVLSKSTKASAAGKASARKRYGSRELPFNDCSTDDEPLRSRTDTEAEQNPSRAKTPRGEPTKSALVKTRHAEFKEKVKAYWEYKNPDVEMPWGPAEGRNLGMWLQESPLTNLDQFAQFLRNRAMSVVNHSERPSRWIGNVTSYANGPLNEFKQPKNGGKYNGKINQTLDATKSALGKLRSTSNGSGAYPAEIVGDVVLQGGTGERGIPTPHVGTTIEGKS